MMSTFDNLPLWERGLGLHMAYIRMVSELKSSKDVFVFQRASSMAIFWCPLGKFVLRDENVCRLKLSPYHGSLKLANGVTLRWDRWSIHVGGVRIPQTWSLWNMMQILKSQWHSKYFASFHKYPGNYSPDRLPSVPRPLPHRGLIPIHDFMNFVISARAATFSIKAQHRTLRTLRSMKRNFVYFSN